MQTTTHQQENKPTARPYHVTMMALMMGLSHHLAASTSPGVMSARQQKIYIESGQYQKDVKRSVQDCESKLAKWHAQQQSEHITNPVAVFDIDETLLSNIDMIQKNHHQLTKEQFTEQIGSSHPTAIVPTIELLREMKSMGMTIVLITGRTEGLKATTEHQLMQAGISKADYSQLICAPDEDIKGDFKERARQSIEQAGAKVVFNVSDQQQDLQGKSMQIACQLPNPFYSVAATTQEAFNGVENH